MSDHFNMFVSRVSGPGNQIIISWVTTSISLFVAMATAFVAMATAFVAMATAFVAMATS